VLSLIGLAFPSGARRRTRSLRIGQDSPRLSTGLPDVDPARPERKKAVDRPIAVRGAAGEVKMYAVLDRPGIGDRHEAHAGGCVLAGPDDDLACSGMGRVKVPRPKISSIRGTGTASRSIPVEASSLGGSMKQVGGRSAPGEVGDLCLDRFRVTPCSRKTAPGGSRPGGRAAHARRR